MTLYGDLRTFRKDIDVLIGHGFIKQVASGFNIRKASIFGFSSLWKKYGEDDFVIPSSDKRYIPKAYRK